MTFLHNTYFSSFVDCPSIDDVRCWCRGVSFPHPHSPFSIAHNITLDRIKMKVFSSALLAIAASSASAFAPSRKFIVIQYIERTIFLWNKITVVISSNQRTDILFLFNIQRLLELVLLPSLRQRSPSRTLLILLREREFLYVVMSTYPLMERPFPMTPVFVCPSPPSSSFRRRELS